MRKVVVGGKRDGEPVAHLAPLESDVFTRLQPLVNHACVTRYDDGTARTPGSVQISTQGSAWCVQVVDPDACAFFRAVGQTLDEALALASLLVESGDAPWEVARWLQAKKKK